MNSNAARMVQSVGKADRVAMIIRHADRHEIPSNRMNDSLKVGLTEKGFEEARCFGSSLPRYSSYRVFHSPAKRCVETAEMIAEGLIDQGQKVAPIEEDWNLCAPYIKDERCFIEASRLGNSFIRSWFSGQINDQWVHGTRDSARTLLAPIIRKLNGQRTGMDIHVSHDWDIMLLRETLLGLKHEEIGWLNYLDGLVFIPDRDKIKVCYHDLSSYVDEDLIGLDAIERTDR
jgi:hypothetical protein